MKSVFSTIKKALGFPDEYNDDHDLSGVMSDDPDDLDDGQISVKNPTSIGVDSSVMERKIAAKITDKCMEIIEDIYSGNTDGIGSVKELRLKINDIVVRSMSSELKTAVESASASGRSEGNSEIYRLKKEIETLKERLKSTLDDRERAEAEKLSATRQKRSLNNRIQDLEKQIMTLEAEREQFQLESRSMVSKIKAAGIRQERNLDSNDDEIVRLVDENNKLKSDIARLNFELAAANDNIDSLRENSSEELTDDQAKAIAEIQEEIEKFEEIKKKKDAKIASQKAEITRLTKEVDDLLKKLQRYDDNASQLNNEISALKQTIAQNLADQAQREKHLRDEIEEAKRSSVEPDEPAEQETIVDAQPESAESTEAPDDFVVETTTEKISAIDELMEDTDWFVAAEPVPLKKDPEVEEIFGYKEPETKKSKHNDDRQLSLF